MREEEEKKGLERIREKLREGHKIIEKKRVGDNMREKEIEGNEEWSDI